MPLPFRAANRGGEVVDQGEAWFKVGSIESGSTFAAAEAVDDEGRIEADDCDVPPAPPVAPEPPT